MGDDGAGCSQSDFSHGVAEAFPILSHVNGLRRGANHLYAELLQHTFPRQVQSAIERRLPTHGWQQGIGALLLDNACYRFPLNGLDINGIGHGGIGHDGGRVGVYQDDPVTLITQCLAGLRTGVVKLAGLTDHNGTSTDNQNALQIITSCTSSTSAETNCNGFGH